MISPSLPHPSTSFDDMLSPSLPHPSTSFDDMISPSLPASAPAAIADFETRVRAGKLDAALARADDALRSLRAARAAASLQASMGGVEEPARRRLEAKLASVEAAHARLARALDGADVGAPLIREAMAKAAVVRGRLVVQMEKGLAVDAPPENASTTNIGFGGFM